MAAQPAAGGLHYRILGHLTVQDATGAEYRIPLGRQQTVLAALLLEVNRTVSLDFLIEAVWEADPPATARTQIQICVSRLRGRLAAAGTGEHIVTQGPGYVLVADNGKVDARSFVRLVAESEALTRHGRLEDGARVLGSALALWRGPALAGIASRALEAGTAYLDEQHVRAVEAHVELGLRLGRHRELVGELTDLVARHPLREQPRARLMLALYRSGRQADALEIYREGRDLLVDQLGLEPGDELRRLEADILAGDPALNPGAAPPAATVLTTPAVLAGPFQLPTDIADFSGRTELIAQVDRLLGDAAGGRATPVVVMAGKPGVGKTALAVHLAHRLAGDAYADGQLYVDLGGARRRPASTLEVLGRFLRALGVAGAAVPPTTDERAAMYRQLVANRRVLVVLDDAESESQVRALLPGTASCLVLITSRVRLTGLAGADVLDVDVLDTGQARQMLGTVIGEDRVAAEPAAAEALIRLVGGLPLALRIVAARLGARPAWSLAWMLERLADERSRLDELAHGELMVRASLALTYDGLGADARRLLRLSSVLDTPTLPAWTGGVLLRTDPQTGVDLLERLVDAQMLEICSLDLDGSPRYRFHGLIRLFAREQLEQHETPAERRAALGRVASTWLGIAAEAHGRLYGGDFTVLHGSAPRLPPPAGYADRVLTDPLAWLEAEHDNLCSVVRTTAEAGLDEWSWDLAVTLVALFEARCSYEDWESTHEHALAAVRAAGNERGEAAVLCSLGSMHLSRARPDEVAEPLDRALATFTALGDELGIAMARRNLAMLAEVRGDRVTAGTGYRRALAGFRAVADPIGEAYVLGRLGQIELDGGDLPAARALLEEALAIGRRTGAERVEMQLRYRLSELLIRQDRDAEAAATLTELLGRVRAAHDLGGELRVLHRLGNVTNRLGRPVEAEALLVEALAVQDRIMDPGVADGVRSDLSTVRRLLRSP